MSMDLSSDLLSSVPPLLSLFIDDLGERHEVVQPPSASVNQFLSNFEEVYKRRPEKISFRGMALRGGDNLSRDCGLVNGDILVASMNIEIIDTNIDAKKSTIIDINDSETLSTLKEEYSKKEKRKLPLGSYFLLHSSPSSSSPPSDIPLNDALSLYSNGIKENLTSLRIVTPSFKVEIRERDQKDNGIFIDIYDYYKVRVLKSLFNQTAMGIMPLSAADKLIFNGEELMEYLYCYQVKMENGSIIYIDREDVTQQRFDYVCADCGSDVKLKKTDAVACRQCGYRIVFKKRTQNVCQYLAR